MTEKRAAFDVDKYLEEQTGEILQRIRRFDNTRKHLSFPALP
jgi:uncharacterized protein (UPF0371 family)